MNIVDHLRRCVTGLELPVPVELAAQAADEIERLHAALAAERERCARIVDPVPGPEPRDFAAHREINTVRAFLARRIRTGT